MRRLTGMPSRDFPVAKARRIVSAALRDRRRDAAHLQLGVLGGLCLVVLDPLFQPLRLQDLLLLLVVDWEEFVLAFAQHVVRARRISPGRRGSETTP